MSVYNFFCAHAHSTDFSQVSWAKLGLNRYLDRTFAQRIASAKVKSKSEVPHCIRKLYMAQACAHLCNQRRYLLALVEMVNLVMTT